MKESKLARKFRKEGQVEARQEDLLMVLRSRFGDGVAAELSTAVKALDDVDLLGGLFNRALSGVSLDDFRSALCATGGV